MNEIQWKAFALIVRGLTILLFQLVGTTHPSVQRWEKDCTSFIVDGEIWDV